MEEAWEENRKALRLARQRLAKHIKTSDPATGISISTLRTAACIGLLSDYDMRAGAAWLQQAHRRGRPLPPGLSGEDVLERLQRYFVEEDPDFLDALRDPEATCLSKGAFRRAERAAKEYRLGQWVREQNLLGKAVRTASLIDRFNDPAVNSFLPRPLPVVAQTEFSTGRNWAMRWRRSQGGLFGKLRTCSAVTRDEKREKVVGAAKHPPTDPLFWTL